MVAAQIKASSPLRLTASRPSGDPGTAIRRGPLALLALLAHLVLAACAANPRFALPVPDAGFAALSMRLSEPGGFFPSDNLVSNETSYLHVLPKMQELGVSGGVYLGVGPDQNFTYIGHVRPHIAFIVDIRRDNLLHHLLFKALFQNSRTRVEYLSLLLGRPSPDGLDGWRDATIAEIVAYLDKTPADTQAFDAAAKVVRASVQSYGLPLSEADLATIRQIHTAFRDRGLDIQYSYGSRYPTYRQLLLETDFDGATRNYLAAEGTFLFVRELQRRNRIVPVVGDLGGTHALAAVGRELHARRLRISAFYVSNVEQYLMRSVAFQQFSETMASLPFDERTVIIRSYFGRWGNHSNNVPGHMSTQLLERFADFVAEYHAGGYQTYNDLVTKNVLPLRE